MKPDEPPQDKIPQQGGTTMDKKLFTPQISALTTQLIDVLRSVQAGDTISYEVLTTTIDRNVRKEARHLLYSARRILRREDAIVFGVTSGVGLRRLTDSEIATSGSSFLRHINRTSRRAVQTLGCVQDFPRLKPDEQIKHNMAMSLFGVFHEITKTRGLKQIEATVAIMQKSLPYKETIRALLV
jgi:hypothetical protein